MQINKALEIIIGLETDTNIKHLYKTRVVKWNILSLLFHYIILANKKTKDNLV